jgi:predicted NBD/HSP70 family sugar kinase
MSDLLAPRGSNLGQLGAFNQSVVLHAVRRADGISRVELGEVTGLAGQTVTNICRRLLDEGLITEGAKTTTGLGKPRTQLHINAGARFAAGVHIDPAVTTVVILDLVGATVAAQRLTTPVADDPVGVVRTVARAVVDLIERSGVDHERLLGVGAAVPGPVDLSRGVVDDPPHLPGWQQVPVRQEFASVTGLPVLLEKDVIAAAVAETWAGTFAEATTAALLYLGTGIGTGLVVNGEVLRGSSGNAGEIGHIVVDPDGPMCDCGQRGCVNATITAQALVRRASRDVAPASGVQLDTELKGLYDRAAAGEVVAKQLVEDAAVGVGRLALVIANLFDVDHLVLGGPYWSRMAPYFFDVVPDLFAANAVTHRIHRVRLIGTPVGDHLGAVGAASLLLDQTYSPRPGSLVLQGP